MSTPSVGAVGTQGAQATGTNKFEDMKVEDFIKMMVTELQNQDPLSPTDSSQILQQVSQIKNIDSSNKLTETLQAVQLGQNISTASWMIGQTISGLDDSGNQVSGAVERVTIADGTPKLQVGGKSVSLNNVSSLEAAN